MKRKVVLYNPKAVFYTMPLGLMAVASCLNADHYDVLIIDGRLEGVDTHTFLERWRARVREALSAVAWGGQKSVKPL